MKKKSIYQKTVIALFLVGFLFIIWGFVQSKPASADSDPSETISVIPAGEERLDEHTVRYRFKFQLSEADRLCLHFISDEKNIKVYIDEELKYALEEGKSSVGKVPGRIFHFIKLPSRDCIVDVISHYKYDKKDGPRPSFWLGDGLQMFKERVRQTLPYAIVYFLILVCGVVLFGCWIAFRTSIKNDKEGFYFSVLLMTMGIWLIRGSEFVSLLFSDHVALTYMGYILFMQIPFQLFCFSVYYWEMECRPWWKKLFCMLTVVNMGVCIVLNMTNILEFKYSKIFAHILLLVSFGNMFKGMFAYLKVHGLDYKVKATLFPSVLVCISTLLDLSGYYDRVLKSYKRGGILVLLVAVSISWSVIKDLVRQLRISRQESGSLSERKQEEKKLLV